MIGLSKPDFHQYSLPEGMWRADRGDMEIYIPGDTGGPFMETLGLVNLFLERLPALEDTARRLLSDLVRLSDEGWSVDGVRVGRMMPRQEVALQLSHQGDIYGLWTITFGRQAGGEFIMEAMSRFQQ